MTWRTWIWLLVPLAVLVSVWGLRRAWDQRVSQAPRKAVAFGKIHVEVLNGCGKNGIARQVGRRLRTLGFDVMTLDNAESFNYPESIVIDRVGRPDYVEQVANALGIRNRIQQLVPDPFRIEEVTVVIGRDYRRLGLSPAQ